MFTLVRRTAILALVLFAVAHPADATELVVIVRHAERETGKGDDGLSPAGKARAERLATLLRDAGITHVFTSDMRRTIETAAPLLTARGLKSVAIPLPQGMAAGDAAARQQAATTAKAVTALPADARVLVVGHSNTVPLVLEALGVSGAITILDTEFDNLFIISPRTTGPPVFTRLRY